MPPVRFSSLNVLAHPNSLTIYNMVQETFLFCALPVTRNLETKTAGKIRKGVGGKVTFLGGIIIARARSTYV
jgi:hypothetical protein